jgi:predicted nuclease with TOPRIM domain
VDLGGVTFVDAAGKARLAEMYGKGAELIGDDIETKALVAEIQTGRADDGNGEARLLSVKAAVNETERLRELQRLQAELHEVNQELARAARPLERLAEMSLQQRQKLADEIRSKLSRWDSVTQQIQQVMEAGPANGENESESQ